jgi:hypothetical protein
MRGDFDFKRHDRIERRLGDPWPVAAVDGAKGTMENEIERACWMGAVRQETVQEFCGFRPDAGQIRGRRKERVEDEGSHQFRCETHACAELALGTPSRP